MNSGRILFVGVFLLLSVTACTGLHNDSKPMSARNADRVDCEEKVRAANASASSPSRGQDEVRMVNECMRQKGWK